MTQPTYPYLDFHSESGIQAMRTMSTMLLFRTLLHMFKHVPPTSNNKKLRDKIGFILFGDDKLVKVLAIPYQFQILEEFKRWNIDPMGGLDRILYNFDSHLTTEIKKAEQKRQLEAQDIRIATRLNLLKKSGITDFDEFKHQVSEIMQECTPGQASYLMIKEIVLKKYEFLYCFDFNGVEGLDEIAQEIARLLKDDQSPEAKQVMRNIKKEFRYALATA